MFVGGADQCAHFAIDELGRLFRIGFLQNRFAGLWHVEADISDFLIHTVMNNLGVSALRHFLQIILCASCDATEKDLLGNTSTQCHAHAIEELLCSIQILLFRQILRIAQTLTARDNGNLQTISILFSM